VHAEGISSRALMAHYEVSLGEHSKVKCKAINARENMNVVDLYFQDKSKESFQTGSSVKFLERNDKLIMIYQKSSPSK
jgi:hypothetical protein